MRHVCESVLWPVTLADGSMVQIWADSVEGLAGPDDNRDYRLCCLMDVARDSQSSFEMVGKTAPPSERVVVTVATFPRQAVRDVQSGMAAG
jgi:hypothetical protein